MVRAMLFQLGYREVRSNHFKKPRGFHVIVHTENPNRTGLSLHIDYPKAPWCPQRHRAVQEDSRLIDEFTKIRRSLCP